MSFRPVFIAVVIAFALIVSAFLVNRPRPDVETGQPSAEFVRATGKCAECHTQHGADVEPRIVADRQARGRRIAWEEFTIPAEKGTSGT